jgi:hypothetical protein
VLVADSRSASQQVLQLFMQPECLLPRSQELPTGHRASCRPELLEFSPHPQMLFLNLHSSTSSFHLCLGLPGDLSPSGFHKILYTLLILLDLIILIVFGEEYNYGAPHYSIFSIFLLFPPPRLKSSPQYPFLKHSQSLLFS